MNMKEEYDSKRYVVCKPWDGTRGPAWTRIFKPQFEAGLRKHTDNFSSLYEFLVSQTDYGGVNGHPHPHGAGLAAIEFQSQAARRTRIEKTYGFILTHITNQDIVDAIEAHVQALPNPPPNDWVSQLWTWIGAQFGENRPTGLLHSNQNDQWAMAKLTDVGIHRETMRMYYSHLLRMNRERQHPYPPIDVWVKFLKGITFPALLRDEAVKQMQNPTYIIPVGQPHAGEPDLGALVQAFEEMWHTKYDAGIEIKPQAPPKQHGVSNRVDGMLGAACDDESGGTCFVAQLPKPSPGGGGPGGRATPPFLTDERPCWRCRGWGHSREECPSPDRPRPIWACIQGLQRLQSSANSRFQTRRPRIVRRGGPSPHQSPYARPAANMAEAEHRDGSDFVVYESDDGGVFAADGEMLRPPSTAYAAAATGAGNPAASKTFAAANSAEPADSADPDDAPTASGANGGAVSFSAEADGAGTAEIDDLWPDLDLPEFKSPTAYSLAAKNPRAAPEPEPTPGLIGTFPSLLGSLIGTVTQFLKQGPGRILMILLLIASAYSLRAPRPLQGPIIIRNAYLAGAGENRRMGIIDSGTTVHTSGRARLFPRHRIQDYDPKISVTIANGINLPVKWRGVMEIKVQAITKTSAKKFIILALADSLYIPDLPVTLISTKALFRNENIRTYLNDRLELVLPTGDIIKISETRTNYIIPLLNDDAEYPCYLGLRDPVPVTWDLLHARLAHFSPDRILASRSYIRGIDLPDTPQSKSRAPCEECVRGAFKGHRRRARPPGRFTRFGQRI